MRLMDMGMDPFNFADALLGILAQRLAKRLCDCKESYIPDAEELRLFTVEYAEELRHSPGLQVFADRADDALHDAVAGAAAIAILEGRHVGATRRDDEGRVADDEVKALSRNGFEEVARAQLPILIIEGRIEGGDGEGPRGQVGSNDVIDMLGQMQCLDAAAGAQVERRSDRSTDGPGAQRQRGPADPQHVIRGERVAGRDLGQVGDHQPVVTVVGIGPQVIGRPPGIAVRGDEPQLLGAGSSQGWEGPIEVGVRLDGAEGEQPDECREPILVAIGPRRAAMPSTVKFAAARSARS